MSEMQDSPLSVRVHIGFFGCCNAGKSSVVNAVTGQQLAIVSATRGTTTDPVFKTMELLPMGPVVIIDTAGIDDNGSLGELRMQKTRRVLNRSDVAILVADATVGLKTPDQELIALFQKKQIPYIVAYNKADLLAQRPSLDEHGIYVSAQSGEGINDLKERIAHLSATEDQGKHLVADLLQPGSLVVLVTPIDSAAPKGRMILPQQQVLRDTLDADSLCVVVQEDRLSDALSRLKKEPDLVITDSQAFKRVSHDTPLSIPLTSFSILMARYKGILEQSVAGVAALDHLSDGDTILMAEGCTHHRQCTDIGTVKIPRWVREHSGKAINFVTSSGLDFPDDLSPYKAIIHCGGCMLNGKEVRYRMQCALDQNVPMTNYGVAIAQMQGILKRSLSIFPSIAALLP